MFCVDECPQPRDSVAEAAYGCQGNQVEGAIKKHGDKDVRWSVQGMLRLMPAAMQRLYQPTLDAIKDAISRILDDKNIQGTRTVTPVSCFGLLCLRAMIT